MTDRDESAVEITAENARPDAAYRDTAAVADDFKRWLATRLPDTADPSIDSITSPTGSGMSSDTLLIDATWTTDGERATHRLVARIAPSQTTIPVFPTYDLRSQFLTMQVVAEESEVAIPRLYWLEEDPAPLGAPFFVMGRVDGVVPPDVLPYNFGSWVCDATPAQRGEIERSSVAVLGELHAIDRPRERFAFLPGAADDSPLRRHFADLADYLEWVVADSPRPPVLDRGMTWLKDHWPSTEGEAVLSWGDARIGNMMFESFRPVAVLDWEMASIAPREMDLAWMIFLHRFFEDIVVLMELPGLPDFLRRDVIEQLYTEATGYEPQHMDWYTMYAAVRHGIIMARVQQRSIHYGQMEMPEDPNGLVMHAATIEAMMAGTYW
jgi:aminoglycoside phosphotransferase (APT) family kinase protein